MKSNVYYMILITLLISCEDVITLDVPTDNPRLIVNAIFRVDMEEEWVIAEVKVSLTNNFFDEIPITNVESITIISEEFDENGLYLGGGAFPFTEVEPDTGIYTPIAPIPTNGFNERMTYALIIRHEGRRYIAQTKYVPAVPIQSLVQGTNTLFNSDETEIIVTIQDDAERQNFYIFDFGNGNFLLTDDQFYNGQTFEFSYFIEQLQSGQNLMVTIMGADRTFYNYMNQLITQSDNTFGFFATPAATVRGNFFDITNLNNIDVFDNVNTPNNYPLGYFAIVQSFSQSLVIEK